MWIFASFKKKRFYNVEIRFIKLGAKTNSLIVFFKYISSVVLWYTNSVVFIILIMLWVFHGTMYTVCVETENTYNFISTHT